MPSKDVLLSRNYRDAVVGRQQIALKCSRKRVDIGPGCSWSSERLKRFFTTNQSVPSIPAEAPYLAIAIYANAVV